MTCTTKFREGMLTEWNSPDKTLQLHFPSNLKKCTKNPHIASARIERYKGLLQYQTTPRLRLV